MTVLAGAGNAPLLAVPPFAADPSRQSRTRLQEDLEDELEVLETICYSTVEGVRARAEAVLATALAYGWPQHAARALLVAAELAERSGDMRRASALVRQVLTANEPDGDGTVTALAHNLLAWVCSTVGLADEAIVHGGSAMRALPPHAPTHVRILSDMTFAFIQGNQLPGDGYREGMARALADAEAHGNPHLLIGVLNNQVWLDWSHGHLADAVAGTARLEAVAHERGLRLNSTVSDTVANVLLAAGDADRAETVCAVALGSGALHVDVNAESDAMLTAARIRAHRGDVAGALEWAGRASASAVRSGLRESQARALQLQAQLHADAGDFERAYRTHAEFHQQWELLRSDLADSRSAVLASEHETARVRRDAAHNAELAERDPMTGVWNRRHLDRCTPGLLARVATGQVPLTVVIIDVDRFKSVNDECSHEVGDTVLRLLAGTLGSAVADPGFVVRLGGDEFLLVLPEMDLARARAVCEQLCRAVADPGWQAAAGLPGTGGPGVTITAGLAAAEPGAAFSEVLRAADVSLYRGKRAGRDRVGPTAD